MDSDFGHRAGAGIAYSSKLIQTIQWKSTYDTGNTCGTRQQYTIQRNEKTSNSYNTDWTCAWQRNVHTVPSYQTIDLAQYRLARTPLDF